MYESCDMNLNPWVPVKKKTKNSDKDVLDFLYFFFVVQATNLGNLRYLQSRRLGQRDDR